MATNQTGDYDYNFFRDDHKYYLNEIKRMHDELNYIKLEKESITYHRLTESPDDLLWKDIRAEASTNPGLADLLAQAKEFYFLSRKNE